ncbi:10746_t:CDS:2, partial [Gigaspora margarita]
GYLLILVILIKTFTTHVFPNNRTIIKHIEQNFTNDNQFANATTTVIDSGYSIHEVSMVAHIDIVDALTMNFTSPYWAAGYYFEINTDFDHNPQLYTTL